MPRQTRDTRHPEADTRPMTVERSDAIDAAAALVALARVQERDAQYVHGYSAAAEAQRDHLRNGAKVYRSAAARLQDAADRSR